MGEKALDGSEIILVTPKLAKEWMSRCKAQDVQPEKVARFVADIKGGNWRTGEEDKFIAVRKEGVKNGYHRLTAIVQANKAVEMKVKLYG